MNRQWLETSIGLKVVAIGLVAIMFSLMLFTIQDFWILVTGKLIALDGVKGISYLLCAGVASAFSAITVFVWRPHLPRVLIALFSVSMASHILEQFVPVSTQQLKLAAICRIGIALALVLLVLRYRFEAGSRDSI